MFFQSISLFVDLRLICLVSTKPNRRLVSSPHLLKCPDSVVAGCCQSLLTLKWMYPSLPPHYCIHRPTIFRFFFPNRKITKSVPTMVVNILLFYTTQFFIIQQQKSHYYKQFPLSLSLALLHSLLSIITLSPFLIRYNIIYNKSYILY